MLSLILHILSTLTVRYTITTGHSNFIKLLFTLYVTKQTQPANINFQLHFIPLQSLNNFEYQWNPDYFQVTLALFFTQVTVRNSWEYLRKYLIKVACLKREELRHSADHVLTAEQQDEMFRVY